MLLGINLPDILKYFDQLWLHSYKLTRRFSLRTGAAGARQNISEIFRENPKFIPLVPMHTGTQLIPFDLKFYALNSNITLIFLASFSTDSTSALQLSKTK